MFEWFALVLFLFPLAYSPGPGNLFFAALSAHSGLGAIKWPMVGYHLATLLMAALIGLGLLKTLYAAPLLTKAVSILGSLYVLYLGAKLFIAPITEHQIDKPRRVAGFLDGAMLLFLNPKAYLIMVLLFTQFEPDCFVIGAPILGALLIATLFTINNLIAFLIWSVAGDQLIKKFRTTENHILINRLFGTMLGAVAIWMVGTNFQN